MMAYEGHPTTATVAHMIELGVYVPPPEAAQQAPDAQPIPAAPPQPKDLAMFVKQIVHTVGEAASVGELLASIDAMIQEGRAVQMSCLSRILLDELPADTQPIREDSLSKLIGGVDDQETCGFIEDAWGILAQLRPIAARFLASLPPDALQEAEHERALSPMGYLTACPVPVARLMLAEDRGLLGACAAVYAAAHPGALVPWQLHETARLWRDGQYATARLYASIAPEEVPEDLVAPSERLDLDALVERRRQEDEFLAKLAASHPSDRFYIPDA